MIGNLGNSNLSFVKWVDLVVAPAVKDDTKGRSLHRANNLDTQTGAGRNYTGEGIGVMVRDDGRVGPHIDFQGRLTNLTAVSNQDSGTTVYLYNHMLDCILILQWL